LTTVFCDRAACSHIKYGDAIAINAGNAAYFLSMHIIQDVTGRNLTEAQRIKMYELYFITLRAGHAGQAFDIKGLDYMMDQVRGLCSCDCVCLPACGLCSMPIWLTCVVSCLGAGRPLRTATRRRPWRRR
jgi:hypothetical protein